MDLGRAGLISVGLVHKSVVSFQVGFRGSVHLGWAHLHGWELASCGLIENSLGSDGRDNLAPSQASFVI